MLSQCVFFLLRTTSVCLVWRVFEEVGCVCKHAILCFCARWIGGGTLWSIVCVCFLFWTQHSFSNCVAKKRWGNKPKSDGTPIVSTWVMNYSLSSSLAWYYHRVCQRTGLTAVTAPRTHFRLTTDTFLICSLPLSCTTVRHSTLFIY